MLILCNILIPQALWSRRVRQNIPAVFVIALVVNVGMWLERFVICRYELHRDFLPLSWGMYVSHCNGTGQRIWQRSACSCLLIFLFVRTLPSISIFELREVVHHESIELVAEEAR